MKLFTVDANPFLQFFLNDIPLQVEAFEQLLALAKNKKAIIYVSQITIFEISFTLDKYYHFPKSDVVERLKTIIQAPYLQVQDRSIFDKALLIYSENNISLADSFVLIYALEKKAELFTFDKKLKNLS